MPDKEGVIASAHGSGNGTTNGNTIDWGDRRRSWTPIDVGAGLVTGWKVVPACDEGSWTSASP